MKRDGWEVKKLGEVCEIKSGKSIQASFIKEDDSISPYKCYGGNGIRGYVDSYTHDGIYPVIGRVGALCGNIHLAIGKFNATEHALIVDIKDKDVNAYWMVYNLKHLDLRKIAKGVAQPVISAGEVMKVYTNIPPLPEQSRIVEELDLLSNIVEKKRQQLSELDNLAQSIFYDMFGDPVTNEKGWEVKKLKDIAISQIGLTYKPENVSNEGTIVLRSSNIQDSCLDFTDIVRVDCNIKEKQYVQEGDILMCSRNGSFRLVGKVAMIKNLKERMSYGAFMTIIRSKYQDYLFTFFKSPAFRVQLTSAKTATINQITVKMLDEINIPLPPLSLQQLFAKKIEAIEKQKALIKQSIAETEELFNCRMDEYFG